jgi:hypothetical protein
MLHKPEGPVMTDQTPPIPETPQPALTEAERRATLPAAARRALEEADARRAAANEQKRPLELGGRNGPDPVRYGDWEKKGIAVDF